MFVEQSVTDYLLALTERSVSAAHIRKSDWGLHTLLSPLFDRELHSLTVGDLNGRLRVLSESYSEASLAGLKISVRAFIRFWMEKGVLTTDITKKLPSYSLKSKISKMIDPGLFDKIRAAVPCYITESGYSHAAVRDGLFVCLSMDSAARAGAMVKIKRAEALKALAAPTIHNGIAIYTVQSAGGKTGPAVLFFTEPTAQLMRLWLGYSTSKEWLFSSLKRGNAGGRRLTSDAVARAFERVCDFAGAPRVRSHAVRHTNITELLIKKVDPETVRAYAGHADVKTTLGYYHDIDNLNSRNAAAALAQSRHELKIF